jgi:hypothetical protein
VAYQFLVRISLFALVGALKLQITQDLTQYLIVRQEGIDFVANHAFVLSSLFHLFLSGEPLNASLATN